MGVLRTALYCRLSKDDMAQGDSESIKKQAPIETDFFHDFIILHVSFPCFN